MAARPMKIFLAAAIVLAAFPLATASSAVDPNAPGCSAKAAVDPVGGDARRISLTVQCDFSVGSIEVIPENRVISSITQTPALTGAGATVRAGESLSCQRRRTRWFPTRGLCTGRLATGTTAQIQLRITIPACRKPQAKFLVSVFGGPECPSYCPAYAIRTKNSTRTGRSLGCR